MLKFCRAGEVVGDAESGGLRAGESQIGAESEILGIELIGPEAASVASVGNEGSAPASRRN